jgi:hypothetical protein
MRWILVTCTKSKWIIPIQKYLFEKYAKEVTTEYLDVESEPLETWGHNVLKRLPDEEYIVFGLDDYLPITFFNPSLFNEAFHIVKTMGYERFELGAGAHRKDGMISRELGELYTFLEYGKDTPYSVSCQFSIWKTEALRRELSKCTTPWNFEVKGKAKAACFSGPVMRWIEESALSRKWHGVNLSGMDFTVKEELIRKGLINRNMVRV